jgi:hypothetical protein
VAHSRLFFDPNDYTLLRIVNDVLSRSTQSTSIRSLLASYMHPHGIKEMAAPQVLRIAYAIASLLGSLEAGKSTDRLSALRSLKDEVLLSNSSYLQKNTSRVLLQIMKELIRHREDEATQLLLAHDFRIASSGKPRIVRAELEKYHLLEMPEDWNQLAFDHHVHDANTKGRKSPTHLVMDAWIKGVRFLTVVYYNYVEPKVAEELLEAATILDMHIRIGIEVSSRFRGKYVRVIWEPQSYTDPKSFRAFLDEQPVKAFMKEGRQVSAYQQKYVFEALQAYNRVHRAAICAEYGLELDELDEETFSAFVGTGQPSLLHLAKYIQSGMQPKLKDAVRVMADEYRTADDIRRKELQDRLGALNAIDSELLINRYLQPCRNPELHDPTVPQDSPEVPPLLRLHTGELLPRLAKFHSNSRFTLNLSNLSIPDTLELLYDCQGHINNIELYNLKDVTRGKWSMPMSSQSSCAGDVVDLMSPERTCAQICELQKALNDDNVIALKRAIRNIVWAFEEERLALNNSLAQARCKENVTRCGEIQCELASMEDRKAKLLDILFDIENFHKYYKKRPLGSRIGSGSTGQSRHQYGMGVVVLETLPKRAQKIALSQASGLRKRLPVTAMMTVHNRTYCHGQGDDSALIRLARRIPGLELAGCSSEKEWFLDSIDIHPKRPGNIVTLGGVQLEHDNGLRFTETQANATGPLSFKYLNTALKNALKILAGFVPAFLTFALTKDWWVLAYLGGFIWFAITGVRNILQAVLGGGGLKRSPLVQWNSLVSWSRVADDLLYTGFSVPLLDLVVKTLILDQGFGITTSTNPVLLFAAMALTNGIYISSHNTFRGLPRTVIVANFFRSILSIPLAILFNGVLASSMHMSMMTGVEEVLQKWAAIISKLASDCVAAVIEGLGDRRNNIRIRLADYRAKLIAMFDVFARLDVLFPEEDVLDMLQSPKMFMETITYEARDLEKVLIVNALDLMYIWLYQPRASKALSVISQDMTKEEWLIFLRSQYVLKRYREISQLFVDGLVGKNFSKALAFYLEKSDAYLEDMEGMGQTKKLHLKG